MTDALLKVADLRTYFFTTSGIVKAVDGVSFDIRQEEAVGLVGESGCGKTVTGLSLMRLVRSPGQIVSGQIMYKGTDILKIPEKEMGKIRGKEVSMVFQDPLSFLNPVIRVGDQLAEAIVLHQGVTRLQAKARAEKALEIVGLPNPSQIYEYYPHQLSGGMRQRVIIATAISCKPSLLIADEATTALDVTVQAQIMDLVKRLKAEMGLSLLLITHDLGVVAEICDRVYVMYAGKIVEEADVFGLFKDHKHPYTTGLLQSMLSINEHKEELFSLEGSVPQLINPPAGCRFHPRCPRVMATCKENEPKLLEIGPKHRTACWLYS